MDLLVLLLDLNPAEWGKRGQFQPAVGDGTSPLSIPSAAAKQEQQDASDGEGAAAPLFSSVFSQLLIFLNAFLLLSKQNRLTVIAAHPDTAQFLYPLPATRRTAAAAAFASGEQKDDVEMLSATEEDDSFSASSSLSQQLSAQIVSLLHAHPSPAPSAPSLLAGALSLSLCYVNRQRLLYPKLRCRVLTVCCSADSPAAYLPVMNCIFSAHKLSIPLDALVLHPQHSLFLQQAAAITGGSYSHPAAAEQHCLLQLLLLSFLPDAVSRSHLLLERQVGVDYRASCFCHRQAVEQAMVCPVCLAIYCKPTPSCDMCQSTFITQAGRPGAARAGAVKVKTLKEETRSKADGKSEKEEKKS